MAAGTQGEWTCSPLQTSTSRRRKRGSFSYRAYLRPWTRTVSVGDVSTRRVPKYFGVCETKGGSRGHSTSVYPVFLSHPREVLTLETHYANLALSNQSSVLSSSKFNTTFRKVYWTGRPGVKRVDVSFPPVWYSIRLRLGGN